MFLQIILRLLDCVPVIADVQIDILDITKYSVGTNLHKRIDR